MYTRNYIHALADDHPDPCNDAAFVEDYNNCLQCAGPNNVNIWRYYGATLSTAGAKCGLPTEPSSGAVTTAAASTAAAQTSAAPTTAASSAPASSSAAAPATSEAAATTEAATSEAPVSSAATPSAATSSAAGASSAATSSTLHSTVLTSHAVSSAPYYPTAIANGTLSSSVSGVPSPSTNGSASFTSVSPITPSVEHQLIIDSLLPLRSLPTLLLVCVPRTLLAWSVLSSSVPSLACKAVESLARSRVI